MIAAKELRIGNWIDCKGKYEQVELIGYVSVHVKYKMLRLFETINPIPITPSVFKLAGFHEMEDEGKGIGVFMNGIYDFEETIKGRGVYALAIYEDYVQTQIRYVHQLQNLIHALTGKELEIDLNHKTETNNV